MRVARVVVIAALAACGSAAPTPEPAASVVAPPSPPLAPRLAPGQTLAPAAPTVLGPAPADPAVHLVANSSTVCALLASGAAACWGHDLARPTRLPWPDVVDLAMSETQTCARLRDGHAECGAFASGRFVSHVRADHVDELAMSRDAACVRHGGDVTCWRDGAHGQFEPVRELHGATRIAMAMLKDGVDAPDVDAGCAIVAGGHVACFEVFVSTPRAALADAAYTLSPPYVEAGPAHLRVSAASVVPKLDGATAIEMFEADARVCAASAAGYRCATLDVGNQVAAAVATDPATVRVAQPCHADGDDVACSLEATSRVHLPHAHDLVASRFACAIADGRVMCWGDRFAPIAPGPALGLDDAVDVAVRTDQVFAVRANGQLVAWGPRVGHDIPTTLSSLADVRAVATMDVRTCVLRERGRVSCLEDDGAVTDAGVAGASELRATDFSIVARAGDHWLRVASPADAGGATAPTVARGTPGDKPRAEPIAGTDGADDVAVGFTWTCARRGSALSCWTDPLHAIAIDGPVAAFALAADDASADLAVLRPGGHADAVRLSGGRVARVEPIADGVRSIFGTAGPACVATATELVCGRNRTWSRSPLAASLAAATRVSSESDASCAVLDHRVVCTSADTWLLGTGAAIAETPLRIEL
nr:hypothetical protein [Kofleriaceae bacterium]